VDCGDGEEVKAVALRIRKKKEGGRIFYAGGAAEKERAVEQYNYNYKKKKGGDRGLLGGERGRGESLAGWGGGKKLRGRICLLLALLEEESSERPGVPVRSPLKKRKGRGGTFNTYKFEGKGYAKKTLAESVLAGKKGGRSFYSPGQ